MFHIKFTSIQEFIPRGRQAVEEHPGPLESKEQINVATEHLLLHRMQNVTISTDAIVKEFWSINEIFKDTIELDTNESTLSNSRPGSPNFMTEYSVNSEEELYFKGHTAAWSRGISSNENVLPRTCFTCETPIQHAFFCSDNFIQIKSNDKFKFKLEEPKKDYGEAAGICLIGKFKFKYFCFK